MNLYSIQLDQTITNPEFLVDGSSNPLEKHGGIMIEIDDIPLGGPSGGSPYSNLNDVQVKIDSNDAVSIADRVYTNANVLPNVGQMSGTDKMASIYGSVKAELGTIPKVILANNLQKNPSSAASKYLIIPGEYSRVDIAYPVSWVGFIPYPNVVHRWYKQRICWSASGGYYYWYFETISTLPTCPAIF